MGGHFFLINETLLRILPDIIKLNLLADKIFKLVTIPKLSFINILLCEKEKIQQLNFTFRNKNKPTDVLSWQNNLTEEMDQVLLKEVPFGEIAICSEICQQQAIKNGFSFDTEFFRLVTHGITHLVGYTHQNSILEKEMLEIEKKILNLLGLNKIYS